jgi:hypothetical protein
VTTTPPEPTERRVRAVMLDEATADEGLDTTLETRTSGKWGEVLSVDERSHPVEALGLLPPDAPLAKATVAFTYGVSGGGGLKLDVGIASFGVSASYGVKDGLEIEGVPGEARIESLLVPLEVTTQLFQPDGASEWFQRKRYRLIRLDATRPWLGARTNVVPAEELLKRRDSAPIPIGGGNAPTTKNSSMELEVKVELAFKLPLAHGADGAVTDTATLSASLSGKVAAESSCEIPANMGYDLYWLHWLAGACYVKQQ